MPSRVKTSTKLITGRTTSKNASKSWLRQRAARLYSKPLMFALGFMFVGGATLVWASAATSTYSVWDDSAVPKTIAADDRHNLELGMKFKAQVNGYVTGVRFYKSAQNTGTHTGSLWTASGRLLATVTFTNETPSGWQNAMFDKPVSVASGVTYVVSYHAPNGRYSVNFHYFDRASVTKKNLVALRATNGQANGVYRYSDHTKFPNNDGSGANYWVDVVFSSKLINPPVGPAAPGNVAASVVSNKNVVLTWAASSSATQIAAYQVFRDGKLLSETTSSTYVDSTVATSKAYTYTVKAKDANGMVSAASNEVTVTVPASTPLPAPTPVPTSPTPAPAPTPTPAPATTDTAGLSNPAKKEIAMQLVSSAENSSLNWRAQYAYLEDIGDGRGYTGGIIGFCSGTGDMLEVIQYYNRVSPNNILAKYIPALQKVNGTASHDGLGAAFEADWKTAAKDPKFQQSQDYERDLVYFNPAVNQAVADGLHALGQFAYYDAMVMHGPGSDPVSFGGIRATAMKKAKTPAQGGNEATYIAAFLDARKAAMLTEAAHEDTDRVDTEQRVFLNQGNLNLNPPLQWTVYGDSYKIMTFPQV